MLWLQLNTSVHELEENLCSLGGVRKGLTVMAKARFPRKGSCENVILWGLLGNPCKRRMGLGGGEKGVCPRAPSPFPITLHKDSLDPEQEGCLLQDLWEMLRKGAIKELDETLNGVIIPHNPKGMGVYFFLGVMHPMKAIFARIWGRQEHDKKV